MSKLYRDANLTDRLLRRKVDTDDDQDYYTEQVDPGAIYLTVGGTADDGDLTVSIEPLDTRRFPSAPDDVVFTRESGETLDESAEGLHDAFVAALATEVTVGTNGTTREPLIKRFIRRVEYTAATAIVRVIPQPGAPRFRVTASGTGGTMTLTLSPNDTFPITAWAAKQTGANVDAQGEVALSVHAVTSGDEMLGIGTCTFDLQVMRVTERVSATTGDELRPGVADLGTLTGLTLGEEVRVAVGGGRVGTRITNIANRPSSTDALEVRWRDVVT